MGGVSLRRHWAKPGVAQTHACYLYFGINFRRGLPIAGVNLYSVVLTNEMKSSLNLQLDYICDPINFVGQCDFNGYIRRVMGCYLKLT